MASDKESLSAQSKKRTNYLLLVFGIVLALLFLLAWCRMQPKQEPVTVQRTSEDYTIESFGGTEETESVLPNLSSRGDAQLVVTPSEVVMTPNVVIGSEAEAPLILRAENAPILLESKELAEKQEDGFELSGSCMSLERLAKDEECVLKVSWTPKSLRNLQNTLTIQWREHSSSVFRKERTNILLRAQSTDSAPCVVCENVAKKEEKIPTVDSKGNVDELRPDDAFSDDYRKEGDVYIVKEPTKVPLNLKNEVIGTVSDTHDVIDKNGTKIGRLLGDDTIVDTTSGTIIGKAIPLVPAMNEQGRVFGKMVLNGTNLSVVDAKGKVLGFPHVDGQIVDADNTPIGFVSPWGAVIDFMGNFLGVILPNGVVVNGTEEVASMRPMGFAINKSGELVGGVVPRGVGVGAGGRSLGEVSLTGEVKDSFDQVVGHVLLDGTVVDAEMNDLGSVVRQGIVIDGAGKPVGFVNSEGKALNFKGTQIGVMNPDGTAFAHKKFIGTLMPQGQVTMGACSVVGSVYPNGSVVDSALKSVGHITPSGKAVDVKNKELGAVVPWGTAIAPGCHLLGLISLNGSVVAADGTKTGCVNTDGTVQNLQGQLAGEVTPLGLYLNEQNQVVGRVRLDGQIVDNKGLIIGCVYEKAQQIFAYNTQGIVVDENGFPLGGASVGNKAYDENGNWIGDVYFNGWVIGDKGQLKGAVPFTGVVFSDTGKIVGQYNQLTGMLTDANGAHLGRVLPGFSVINSAGTQILGKLIPEKTPFMKLDGSFLGTLRSDGVLVGADTGRLVIHADGSVTDKEGQLVGGRIPIGPVLSSAGKYMGLINQRGEVIDNHQMKIGRVLPNGLAISDKNQVMGQVFPTLSVGVSTRGFVGSIEPKMSGIAPDLVYQLQVNDAKGNMAGRVSGTGVILGMDNAVAGQLVPVAPFVDGKGKILGWTNFQGEMNNPDGRSAGTILPSGIVMDGTQHLVGTVVHEGVVVDAMGAYLGHLGASGELLTAKGERIAVINGGNFLYNADGAIVGQILKPGIAVDLNNQFLGWTRYDGQIENGMKVLGSVGLDGHVFDANGQMIGRYAPLGLQAFNDAEKSVGFLSDLGEFIDAGGLGIAALGHDPYVATKGTIIGREMQESRFVTSLEAGRVLGIASESAAVMPVGGDKSLGTVKMNYEFIGASHQVEGGLVPVGLATMPTLGLIGEVAQDGQVYKAGKKVATTTGTGLVYSTGGELIGGMFTPGVLIDKKGAYAGMTTGTPSVMKEGKHVGNKLAFGSALSTDNGWIGNLMPQGGIVDDNGFYYGVVTTTDGTVVAKENAFGGRVLPDGSVVGVPEKAVFNTMPYAGHTILQGLPIGLNATFSVVGDTTVTGDVIDHTGKKLFRIIDNGYVINKVGQNPPVVARVWPIISAVNNEGSVMGVPSANGTVVSYKGDITGRVDNAGIIRLNNASSKEDEFRIQGLLVPEGLVVNDCKIVGQTAYDGRVINGQGAVVGRIRSDRWAVDANGQAIGRVARNNEFCIKERSCVGRVLPDSTVVDLSGVEVGCATNSGEVLSPSGEVLCTVVERGVIVGKSGEILGWTRACGIWTNGESDQGSVDAQNNAYNWNNEVVGVNVPADWTVFTNSAGNIEYTQSGEGLVRDPEGTPLILVPPSGPITDPWGNPLPGLNPYIPGLGYLQECELIGPDGQKVASLNADATLRDDKGDLLYRVGPDGQVYNPYGNLVERFRGIDVSAALKQCGLAEGSRGGNRRISVGSTIYAVDPQGSILDDDGTIVGYLGGDGRPYIWDNKSASEAGNGGRERPDTAQTFKPTAAQLDDFQEKLAKKRQGMKTQMGKGILTISAEMKARAKPKKDRDWEALGYGRSKDNTSTWPVDMSHVILQGKAIPAVLARSIDSRYMDVPAVAIVETNIYGEEGRNVLIPAGSRLIGQMSGTEEQQNGVAKLQITWNRLIRPDGAAFNLAGAQSGDAQGRGGVAAYLDEQLWNKYGTSILGVLAQSAVAYMMATNDDISTTTANGGTSTQTNKSQAANDARKAFIDEIGSILDDMIARAQQTPPVVFVPAGTRLTVFPQRDLWLRSVEDDEKEANEAFGTPPTQAQTPNVASWSEKRKNEQDFSRPSSNDRIQKETEKPLYDGVNNTMPDISDRKVEPVAPEEELLL